MGIWSNHFAVDKSRSLALTDISHRLGQSGVASHRIGAIALRKMEIRKARHQFGNIAARGLHLYRN